MVQYKQHTVKQSYLLHQYDSISVWWFEDWNEHTRVNFAHRCIQRSMHQTINEYRTLSCCEHCPLRFRGMFVSIFARTSVMLDVTRQTLAKPSCITTAPRSARCIGSHAISTINTISSINIIIHQHIFSTFYYFPCTFSYHPLKFRPKHSLLDLHLNSLFLPESIKLQNNSAVENIKH